jgi:hypothetical protein
MGQVANLRRIGNPPAARFTKKPPVWMIACIGAVLMNSISPNLNASVAVTRSFAGLNDNIANLFGMRDH